MADAPLQQFAKKCCTRQHLTLEQWGLLEDCTRLTHGGDNPFLLDGRTAAARFCQTEKNAIYRVIKSLERDGWLLKTGGGSRNKKTGMFDPTVYRIVTHEEWIKGKKHTCPDLKTGPVPKSGQAPVPKSKTTSPDLPIPPVPDSGHSSVTPSVKIFGATPLCPATAKSSFLEKQESKGEAHAVSPSSPDLGTGVPTLAVLKAKRDQHRAIGGLEKQEWDLLNQQIAFLER